MVSDIVKKIGVAKGTFYYYFSSKEEIIEALINFHLTKFKDEIEKIAISKDILPSHKIELMAHILFDTLYYKQGLLLEFLYNDQYLHLMDKFFLQSKKLLTPILFTIIGEGKKTDCFDVPDVESAVNYMLSIMQCHVEAIYEKKSPQVLSSHLNIGKGLIEKILGLPEGTLKIRINPKAE